MSLVQPLTKTLAVVSLDAGDGSIRPWVPTDLPGLALWLDGNDGGSVTVSSDRIDVWADKSGNARNFTPSAPGAGPNYVLSAINGKPAARFASGTNLLNTGYPLPTEYSIYAVASATTNVALFQMILTAVTNTYCFFGTSTVTQFATFFGSGSGWISNLANAPTRNVGTPQPSILGVVKANTASGAAPFFNGEAQDVRSGETASTTGLRLGGLDTGVQEFWGDVGEIFITHSLLATSDRQKLEGYLAHKWQGAGASNELPSGHPYKNVLP